MKFDRRTLLGAGAGALVWPGFALAQEGAVLRPEDFGARGDGQSNDTAAFAALSRRINQLGGGTIMLSGKTYVVGEQRPGGEGAFAASPIIQVANCSAPVRIIGNGARLRCQPGLRYGAFSRSGRPLHGPMPNYRREEIATPYDAMISIRGCRGPVEVRDVELDGNLEQLQIGGQWGDTGWQIAASGLWLWDNKAAETVINVRSHHHGQDGAMINGDDRRASRSRIERLVCQYNGRQGLSIVGGRGYDFSDCDFNFTGRSAIYSGPGAGVDIEAEGGKRVRDLTFTGCKFRDNKGVGLLANDGDSANVRFADCEFIGTTTWAAWPMKPGFSFTRCTFAGAVVNAFADADPGRATKFLSCRFTDDPALSSSGRVFEGADAGGPIVNLGESKNVTFDDCRFELVGRAVLPWSWAATYKDCIMSQVSKVTATTRGKYLGRSVIAGPVDLYGSMIVGDVILNGRAVPKGPVGSDVKPW